MDTNSDIEGGKKLYELFLNKLKNKQIIKGLEENTRMGQLEYLKRQKRFKQTIKDPIWKHYYYAIRMFKKYIENENLKKTGKTFNQTKTKKMVFNWFSSYLLPSIREDSFIDKLELWKGKSTKLLDNLNELKLTYGANIYIISHVDKNTNEKSVLKMNGINYKNTIYDFGIVGCIINQKLNILHVKHPYNQSKYPVCENFVRLNKVYVASNEFKNNLKCYKDGKEIKLKNDEEILIQKLENLDVNVNEFLYEINNDKLALHKDIPYTRILDEVLVRELRFGKTNMTLEILRNKSEKEVKKHHKDVIFNKELNQPYYANSISDEKKYNKNVKSIIFQIIYALKCGNDWFGFSHQDFHRDNIMFNVFGMNDDETRIEKDMFFKIIVNNKNIYYKIPNCAYLVKILDFDMSMIYKDELLKDRTGIYDDDEDFRRKIIMKSLENINPKNDVSYVNNIEFIEKWSKRSNMYRSYKARMHRQWFKVSDLLQVIWEIFIFREEKFIDDIIDNVDKNLREFIIKGVLGSKDDKTEKVAIELLKIIKKYRFDENTNPENISNDLKKEMLMYEQYEKVKDNTIFNSLNIYKHRVLVRFNPYLANRKHKSFDDLLEMEYFDDFRIKEENGVSAETKFNQELKKSKDKVVYIYKTRPRDINYDEYRKEFL